MSTLNISYTTRYIVGVNRNEYELYPANRKKDLLDFLDNSKGNIKRRGNASHQNFDRIMKTLTETFKDLGIIIYGAGEESSDLWYLIYRNGEKIKRAALDPLMIQPRLGGLHFRAGIIWITHPDYMDTTELS